MNFDITREDVLILLSCMGVDLSKDTKIPDDALNKRLLQALDAAQRFTDLLGVTPLNPSDHPKWASPKPLLEAVSTGNMTEAFENIMSGANTSRRGTSTAKKDTFKEVRQIVMGLSSHYDQGRKYFVLWDAAAEWGIVVRVVDVFSLRGTTEVPLFGLLYKVLYHKLHERLEEMFEGQSVVSISTTELERKMVLKLFAHNGKRLSPDYQPSRTSHEDSFRLTFLLPLGPLNMRDLGKLTSFPGCEVCGKRETSKCTQCYSVSYCGKDCQRKDWNTHKTSCRSLKGGTWVTMTFEKDALPNGLPGTRLVVNRLDSAFDTKPIIDMDPTSAPPPNIHGEKTFLVKFQISLYQFGDESSMLIYDRQRSFQVHWKKSSDRAAFAEGQKAMADRLKIYRWARRIGDYQLSVCFDRAPEKDPIW